MKKCILLSLILLPIVGINACDYRGDSEIKMSEKNWVFEQADSFLQYMNTQASLGAGEYELVVATRHSNQFGEYNIEININGENKLLFGVWNGSAGLDPYDLSNPGHRIVLSHAGGLTTETTTNTDSYLYLLKNGYIVAEGKELRLPISQINTQAYTDAYYRAVDPKGERKTLDSWQRTNGFDKGHDVHVVFRDTKDLGYGRNMYARKDEKSGNISFFVKNYAADMGGDEGQYNFANVIAAINEMSEYHIGTNAIEFSPIDPTDPNSEKILKFFTFRREDSGSTIEYRQDTIDLDGRGAKQMPVPCLVCHGARLLPLDENGEFQLLSLKTAKLNQLEKDTFEFAKSGIFTEAAIENDIKLINEYVHEVYAVIGMQNRENFDHWSSDFALELSEGRYGGIGFPEATYQKNFIPDGWKQKYNRPDGVEQLFTEVIQPHCISCHSIRGSSSAERNNANNINFSSYEKFIRYNDALIDYVYKRGVMPLSILNFNKFWWKRDGPPALLASFLTGFDLYDNNNLPSKPGAPFAKPGDDRHALSPIQLNGSASLFARNYQWVILSKPPASIATLDNPQIPNPALTANVDGQYTLRLTVSNNLGSHSDDIVITIDNSVYAFLDKHQSELTFVNDIMENIMGASTGAAGTCANCHRSKATHLDANPNYDGKYDGIPVFYSLYDDEGNLNRNLYRHVKARINLADPENSLLLQKPLGNHHGGDVQIDRNTFNGERRYQILLNWIREGAICGSDLICQ